MRPITCLLAAAIFLVPLPADTVDAHRAANNLKLARLSTAGKVVKPPADRPGQLPATRLCHAMQMNAMERSLPPRFFIRLIWKESRFRHNVVSKRGARGIAQFMPKTAEQWGLADPFDSVSALKKSAELLEHLVQKFGNIGIAAAAYNAGPGRVRKWLKGRSSLPRETRNYVAYITRRDAEAWRTELNEANSTNAVKASTAVAYNYETEGWCLDLAAKSLGEPWPRRAWHVRVEEDVSHTAALSKVAEMKEHLDGFANEPRLLLDPLDKAGADGRPRYAVDISLVSRTQAWALCSRLRDAGDSCRVVRG